MSAAQPFRRLPLARLRRFRNAVPLYSLKAAAGSFGAQQALEPEDWVVPLGRTRPSSNTARSTIRNTVAGTP